MNWIFFLTLVFCVITIRSEDEFGNYYRFYRQVNPIKKCNTCTSASECQAKQQVSECSATKVPDLFEKAAEPVKSFWAAVMTTAGAKQSFDNLTDYSQCFTIQFQSAGKAGELRSCCPEKIGTLGFCEAVTAATNKTAAKISLCKTCKAVADKPCNNEPPLLKPASTTEKPAPSSAFLKGHFPIFNVYHFLIVLVAAKFII